MIIVAIGKNYVSDIKDKPADKGEPLIFTKPESTVLTGNAPFQIPPVTQNVVYEVELAFRIGTKGKNIAVDQAMTHVDALALAIDFTAKDVLNAAREKKSPWALAKGFDGATPLSKFIHIDRFPDVNDINFSLDINGERLQTGHSSLMIFNAAEVIAYVSTFMTLNPGDVILTGTPAHGTGSVKPGDRLTAKLEGENVLDFEVL